MRKILFILSLTFIFSACEKTEVEQIKPDLTNFVDFSNFELSGEELALLDANAKSGLTKVPAGPAPFWARVGFDMPQGMPVTEEYGIIYFYVQNTSDVTATFNLLVFFDPTALGKETSTEGSIWLKEGSLQPYMTKINGKGAVPFWIITADQVTQVNLDGKITMDELESLIPPPSKGIATKFSEGLWPYLGGAPVPGILTIAEGVIEDGEGDIEDGQRFKFHFHAQSFDAGEPLKMSVKFKLF